MCVRFVIAILAVVTIFAADARAQEQSGFEGAIAEARAAMMRDPSAALELAEGAESFVQNPQRYAGQQQLAEAEWLQAEATTRLGRPVEAAEIAERALERLGSNPQPSKLFADLNVARGRIAMAMGEFDTAFISFSAGYEVFRALEILEVRRSCSSRWDRSIQRPVSMSAHLIISRMPVRATAILRLILRH